MNKENCALKLVDEIILYYDARSKKHQISFVISSTSCHLFTVLRRVLVVISLGVRLQILEFRMLTILQALLQSCVA